MNNLKSPAITYAVPDPNAPKTTSADDVEQLLRDAGAPIDEDLKKNTAEQNTQMTADVKAMYDREQEMNQAVQKTLVKDKIGTNIDKAVNTVAGVGAGAVDIVQNIYNGVVGLADAAENLAAKKGIGTGELITEANKWTPIGDQGLGAEGEISRKVTNYAGPLLATMASGGGTLVGMGVNAAYNFLAVDPKQSRISDILADTKLAEVPVAMEMIDFLKTKPGESEMHGRMMNMMEGAGIDVAVAGVFYAAAKTYQGISKLRNPGEIKAIGQKLGDAEAMVKNPAPVASAEEAALKASDEAISSTDTGAMKVEPNTAPVDPTADIRAKLNPPRADDTVEDLLQFDTQWQNLGTDVPGVHTKADGTIGVNVGDEQLIDFLNPILADAKNRDIISKPITDPEMLAQARKLVQDPEVVARLGNYNSVDGPLRSEEVIAMKLIASEYDNSFLQSAIDVINNPGDDALKLKFMGTFDNSNKLERMVTGQNREAGKSLRAVQVIATAAGLGDKEAMTAIGKAGRTKLAKLLMDKHGGAEGLDRMAQKMAFTDEFNKIMGMEDKNFFMNRMGEINKHTFFSKMEDRITAVALNGMLSSPATPIKAMISNALTTGKTIGDNYLQAAVFGSTKSFSEANAHVAGAYEAFFNSIKPAAQAFVEGKPINVATMNMDFLPAAKRAFTQEEVIEQSSGAWAKVYGITGVKDVDSAVNMPARILISTDSYWQSVNAQAHINAEAVKNANARGLVGDAHAAYVDNFKLNTPADVVAQAEKLASTNTFAKNLTGWLETANDGASAVMDRVPFGKVILPFLKTNINVAEYTVLNSPLGFMAPSVQRAIKAGGTERAEALTKMLSGGIAMSGLGMLAANGMITGPWSENKNFSKALSGNDVPKESSIKIGDTWVSMKGIQPFESLVNTSFILSKASGWLGEKESEEYYNMAMAIVSETLAPEALTGGVAQIIDLISANNGDNAETKSMKVAADIAGRFVPLSALVRDVRETTDGSMRDVRTDPNSKLSDFNKILMNKFSNSIPFFSKDLPPKQNVWGEELMLPDGVGPDAIAPFAASTGEGLALKKSLEMMGQYYELNKDTAVGLTKFSIQMPLASIANPMASVQYKLDPKEYSAYVKLNAGIDPETGKPLIGKTLKTAISDVFNKYDAMGKEPYDYDPETYARMTGEMAQTFNLYRKIANGRIKMYGDIPDKMRKQAEQARMFERMDQGEE